LNLSPELFDQSKNALERLDEFLFRINPELDDAQLEGAIQQLEAKILTALDNDLNTPQALGEIFQFVRAHNAETSKLGRRCVSLFRRLDSCFDFFKLETEQISDGSIQRLIEERQEARKAKNFARADEIRDQLLAKGIQIYDTKDGVKWRLAK